MKGGIFMSEMQNKFIEFMKKDGLSENTYMSYTSDVKLFEKYYNDSYGEELDQIIHADISTYINHLFKHNISPKTINRKVAALKMYNPEQATFYVNKYADRIFYDVNLKKQDIYNYNLVSEIYNNSISVVNTLNKSKFISASKQIVRKNIGLSWIYDKLKDLDKDQFTFTELSKIFTQDFKEHGLKWTDKVVKNYFPQHDKKKKKINGKQETYYTFYL